MTKGYIPPDTARVALLQATRRGELHVHLVTFWMDKAQQRAQRLVIMQKRRSVHCGTDKCWKVPLRP